MIRWPIKTGSTTFRKGTAKDEAGTVFAPPWNHWESVQRGGCPDRHRVQAALSGDDPPSGVEQVFWQSGRSVDGAGLRRERERQDGLAASGGRRARSRTTRPIPHERVLAISYDDFNPYLDSCRAAMRAANMDAVLASWKLQDHMDAILSLGVTKLVDLLTSEKAALTVLSLDQRRDLLLLAALYDASTGEPIAGRWSRLRRRSGFRPLWTRRDLQIGVRHELGGHRADRPVPEDCEGRASCPGSWSRSGRLALLGLAAGARRVVRPRYSQGPARLEPRSVGPALGAALVQADRTGRPAAADRVARRRRRTIRALAQVRGGARTPSVTRGSSS